MQILSSPIKSSFTIKKSKFLCFGYLIKSKLECKSIIDSLKKEYPDASHICYAYVLDDKTFYFTDGGEPSGTAGKPIYGAIQSFKLNYTLLVVVRYFGGIKFGPGPLRSTFKDVATQTLKLAKTKSVKLADVVQINITYDRLKEIKLMFNRSIAKIDYQKDGVKIDLVGNVAFITKQLSLIKIKPLCIKKDQLVG